MKARNLLWLLTFITLHATSQVQKKDSFEILKYFPNGKVQTEYWVKIFGHDTLIDGQWMGYYENGNIFEKMTWRKGRIASIRELYNKKGRIIFTYTYNEGDFPRTIISQAYYYDFLAACTYSVGTLIETGYGPTDYQQHGIAKFFRRNGVLMDSLVYDHNEIIYRAKFNSKGKLVNGEYY